MLSEVLMVFSFINLMNFKRVSLSIQGFLIDLMNFKDFPFQFKENFKDFNDIEFQLIYF